MKAIRNKLENLNKTKLRISIILIVLLLLSFFFSAKIENALGFNIILSKNETTKDNIAASKYEVTYLDVGQGNSTFIKLPDGKVVLVDGGNYMYSERVTKFLKDKDIKIIDYIIATHADADHISGLISVLDNFEVKHILRPFQIAGTGTNAEIFEVFEYEDLKEVYEYYQNLTNGRSKINRVTSNVYKEFIEKIYTEIYYENNQAVASDVTVFYDGLVISGENYTIEFFAPLVRDETVNLSSVTKNTDGYATMGYGASDSNGNSAIFLLSCYGDKFLFTGDAAFKDGSNNPPKNAHYSEIDFVNSLTESERELFSNITVYLAGHHGSLYSSSDELLSLINPRFVVFSVGKFNDYGHPASEVIFRINKTTNLEIDYLLRTDINGKITFVNISGRVYFVKEKDENSNIGYPSWEMFSSVMCLYFICLIYSIKPLNIKNKGLLRKYK